MMVVFGMTNTVSFDCGRLAFLFQYPVDIYPPTSDSTLSVLGFAQPDKSAWSISGVTMSTQPIKLSGPSCIHVTTEYPLFNIPVSGRLATIGVNVNYGELLLYFDDSCAQPAFLTSQYLDKLTITLTDENNDELTCYEDLPWSAVISVDPVEDTGFQQLSLDRGNVDATLL